MTEEEAVEMEKTGWWKTKTAREIVRFQLFEERLCMPFGDFHKAVEDALGHPIDVKDFENTNHLQEEFMKGE